MQPPPNSHGEPEFPLVGAVVLNWNAREETLACLDSLAASDWPRLQLIVVDNASAEDIESAVLSAHPQAEVIRNGSNLGFGGGMNAGMRRALELGCDYVLLLNNDTAVDKAMVRVLVETARDRPDAGIVSPIEFFRDAPDTVSSAGLRCNLNRGYQGPPLGRGERDLAQFRGVAEVDSSSGAAMLVPATTLKEVGLLDDALYLYIEDVEWSLRMRQRGKRVYVAYDARLWHGVSTSSGGGESPQVTYYHTRNVFIVCARHAPLRGPRGLARHIEILLVNVLHALRCRRPVENVCAVIAGWRDYLRGRAGPRPGAPPAAPSDARR